MKIRSKVMIGIAALALAVLGAKAISAQDKYTVEVPGGLAFSEFRGYEDWPVVAMSENGGVFAAYKVADSVKTHEAWGLGSYCFFNVDPTIHAAHSFEVPDTPGVKLHDILTVSLGGVGTIDHVVNDTGAAAQGAATIPVNLVSYP